MNGLSSSVALMQAACAFASVVAWSAAPPACCTTVRSSWRPLMPPHSLTISAKVLSMSTGSPRLYRKPCGESPGCRGGSIATTLIESAVTPGAVAFRPVCFAVSLVQNEVVDVNGDVDGSGVTRGAAAAAAVAPTPAVHAEPERQRQQADECRAQDESWSPLTSTGSAWRVSHDAAQSRPSAGQCMSSRGSHGRAARAAYSRGCGGNEPLDDPRPRLGHLAADGAHRRGRSASPTAPSPPGSSSSTGPTAS